MEAYHTFCSLLFYITEFHWLLNKIIYFTSAHNIILSQNVICNPRKGMLNLFTRFLLCFWNKITYFTSVLVKMTSQNYFCLLGFHLLFRIRDFIKITNIIHYSTHYIHYTHYTHYFKHNFTTLERDICWLKIYHKWKQIFYVIFQIYYFIEYFWIWRSVQGFIRIQYF